MFLEMSLTGDTDQYQSQACLDGIKSHKTDFYFPLRCGTEKKFQDFYPNVKLCAQGRVMERQGEKTSERRTWGIGGAPVLGEYFLFREQMSDPVQETLCFLSFCIHWEALSYTKKADATREKVGATFWF